MDFERLEFPDALYYDIPHQMWARLEEGGLVAVGITALGIALAGEIYMCRPRRVGTAVTQGGALAVAELAKTLISVKSPVSGVIMEVNLLLEERPERVHQDPYGQGWLVRIRPDDFAQNVRALLHGEAVLPAMREHARLNRMELAT